MNDKEEPKELDKKIIENLYWVICNPNTVIVINDRESGYHFDKALKHLKKVFG